MDHFSEVVFDLAPIDAPEDAYQLEYVRLVYGSVEDLPARLYSQLPGSAPGVTDTDDDRFIVSRDGVPDVISMVGAVIEHEAQAGRLSVEFGSRPELLINLRPEDLVPVEEPYKMPTPRLARRRQHTRADKEALARRAEGWDYSEADVIQEWVALDPTGTGESGVPLMENEDRAMVGQGADQITKVYLVNRKDPIEVMGELEKVRDQIWTRDDNGEIVLTTWAQFQRVTKEGMVSADDIVINPQHVVSLQSVRL